MSSEILGFRNQREHTIKFGKIHFLLKREFIGILMVEHWCFFPFTICNETTDQGIILQKQLRNVKN